MEASRAISIALAFYESMLPAGEQGYMLDHL